MFRLVVALLLIFAVSDTCQVRAQAPKNKRATRVPSPKHQAPTAQPGAAGRDRAFSLDSINDVLWWLPEDTQTVSVVRGPFKAIAPIAEPPEDNPTAPISEPPEDNPTTEQVSLVLQMHPLGGFEAIKKGRYYKPLVGRNVLFGVEASRKFRSPTGLGEMRYEGCDIVILQPGLGTARDALLKQMASQAKQVQTIAGQQVTFGRFLFAFHNQTSCCARRIGPFSLKCCIVCINEGKPAPCRIACLNGNTWTREQGSGRCDIMTEATRKMIRRRL